MAHSCMFFCCILVLHLIILALSLKLPSEEEQFAANRKKMGMHSDTSVFGQSFGEFTEKIGHEIFPATRELLHHFKERKFSLIVGPSTMYVGAASKIVNEYNNVVSVAYLAQSEANYTIERDFESILLTTLEASREAKVIILLMELRLAKECLAAAYDLQLNTSDHVFVAYEVDFSFMAAYQRRPFKWSTMDFVTSVTSNNGNFNYFLFRSRKLCWMLEHTFIIMVTLPKQIMQAINQRPDISYGSIGKVDENIGFSTAGDYHVFINEKGDVEYPLAVYRYGKKGMNAGSQCAKMLTNTLEGNMASRSSFPKMYPVAKFYLMEQGQCTSCTRKWKLSLVLINKLHTHWPLSENPCGEKCKGSFHLSESVFVISGAVLLLLVFIIIHREYTKTRKENDIDKCSIPVAEYKQPVDV